MKIKAQSHFFDFSGDFNLAIDIIMRAIGAYAENDSTVSIGNFENLTPTAAGSDSFQSKSAGGPMDEFVHHVQWNGDQAKYISFEPIFQADGSVLIDNRMQSMGASGSSIDGNSSSETYTAYSIGSSSMLGEAVDYVSAVPEASQHVQLLLGLIFLWFFNKYKDLLKTCRQRRQRTTNA